MKTTDVLIPRAKKSMSGHITAESELVERTASWSELFFDLGFVAVVAQVTYMIIENHKSVESILMFLFLAYITFWAWARPTILKNILNIDDTITKMMVVGQTFFALVASIFISTAFTTGLAGFAFGIFGIKLLMMLTIIYGYKKSPKHRPKDPSVNRAFWLSTWMWGISIFLPMPFALLFWALAQAIETAAPFITTRNEDIIKLNKYHLPERLGLFVMLVIGESLIVIGLINKLALQVLDSVTLSIFFLIFIVMSSLWWIYFNLNEIYLMGKRFPATGRMLELHQVIVVGVMLLAVGVQEVMKDPSGLVIGYQSFVLWAAILILASIAAIRILFHQDLFRISKELLFFLTLLGACLFVTLSQIAFLLIVSVSLSVIALRVIIEHEGLLDELRELR